MKSGFSSYQLKAKKERKKESPHEARPIHGSSVYTPGSEEEEQKDRGMRSEEVCLGGKHIPRQPVWTCMCNI